MITDFKDPAGFISKLCSILIDELDKAPDSPAVWFALDKDKNVLDIGETVKNIRDSLGGSQNKMQKHISVLLNNLSSRIRVRFLHLRLSP